MPTLAISTRDSISVLTSLRSRPSGDPHHLIDIMPPSGEMSLARYQDLANEAITDVATRRHLPILTGGTPLYINAVVEGGRYHVCHRIKRSRARCEAEAQQDGGPRCCNACKWSPIHQAQSGAEIIFVAQYVRWKCMKPREFPCLRRKARDRDRLTPWRSACSGLVTRVIRDH